MEDPLRFLPVAESAVREAGRFLRDNLDTRAEATLKGAVDLVTKFDTGAQEILAGRLLTAFPDHGILAEENLSKRGYSDFRWILDPLDGTTNFAHTHPVFCISAALEQGPRVILGLVYDPTRDEMFVAAAGQGSRLNGRPIHVSNVKDLDRSLLATGFPYDIRTSRVNNLDHWNRFIIRAQATRRCGSAALDLSYVACGRVDGFWELKLNPWDVAAGELLVTEAGGQVTDFSGRPHRIDVPEALATNGLIHKAMMEVLAEGQKITTGDGTHGKN